MQTTYFHKPTLMVGALLAVAAGGARAEQTTGIQNVAATPAVARANVNVRVAVPKTVILRVGDANGNVSDVNFSVSVTPAVVGAPGNALPYAGTIPPVLGTSVVTTNPTGTTGVLVTGAWTNVTGGAKLTCTLGATGTGETPFASGATAGGVPGTADILVAGTTPAHPGASLQQCDGTANSSIAALTSLVGTFTYSTNFASSAITAGNYGNKVTYVATTP